MEYKDIDKLLEWYERQHRVLPWRETKDPYAIWISEIMLQQTRVEAVKDYYFRFLNACPTVYDLANIEDDVLMKLWQGLGYYSRAKNLKKAAVMIVKEHNGILPCDYALLRKLPGIGEYTAGAILSFAYQKAIPAVDGNVMRVISRYLGSKEDILQEETKKYIRSYVETCIPKEHPGMFNQALIELGATLCGPNTVPNCAICPFNEHCMALKNAETNSIPVKGNKKARKTEDLTVFVIHMGQRLIIRKRPNKGLLAGLYELPNIEGHLSVEKSKILLESIGFSDVQILPLEDGKHIFTHIEWNMKAYGVEVSELSQIPNDWLSITYKEYLEQYAIPSAFAMYQKYYFN